ncbi:LDL receptor repeat-containing protein egg-1-like [Mya arenaria]|uniref:LDL receptor repeat-containing protein egg-1-like n=1 Tax=Mya arenaria TaxID=6604 RepID=UPI0022E72A24|nr:LDL receptor repeat-containing protein egg-1-like [Mya arenaria]
MELSMKLALVILLVAMVSVSARHKPRIWNRVRYNGLLKCDFQKGVSSSKCISASQVCDGIPHCTDGADELNCSPAPTCPLLPTCPQQTTCPPPTSCPPPTACPTTIMEMSTTSMDMTTTDGET